MQRPDLLELLPPDRRSPMPTGWRPPIADPYAAMARDADEYERGAEQYDRAAQVLSDRATFYRHAADREQPDPAPAAGVPPLDDQVKAALSGPSALVPGDQMHIDIADPMKAMHADADMYDYRAREYRKTAEVLRERARVYRETAARERSRPAEAAPAPMGDDPLKTGGPLNTGRFSQSSTAAAPPADGARRDAAVAAGMPS